MKIKYTRNIDDNAVQGRLSKNYLTRKLITQNILYIAIYGNNIISLHFCLLGNVGADGDS